MKKYEKNAGETRQYYLYVYIISWGFKTLDTAWRKIAKQISTHYQTPGPFQNTGLSQHSFYKANCFVNWIHWGVDYFYITSIRKTCYFDHVIHSIKFSHFQYRLSSILYHSTEIKSIKSEGVEIDGNFLHIISLHINSLW